jgi:hypothetical protein
MHLRITFGRSGIFASLLVALRAYESFQNDEK